MWPPGMSPGTSLGKHLRCPGDEFCSPFLQFRFLSSALTNEGSLNCLTVVDNIAKSADMWRKHYNSCVNANSTIWNTSCAGTITWVVRNSFYTGLKGFQERCSYISASKPPAGTIEDRTISLTLFRHLSRHFDFHSAFHNARLGMVSFLKAFIQANLDRQFTFGLNANLSVFTNLPNTKHVYIFGKQTNSQSDFCR